MTNKPVLKKISRMLLAIALVACCFLFFYACSSHKIQPNSGINGKVLIGPVTPVQKEGDANVKPFPGAVVLIMDSAGEKKIAEVISDKDGLFRVNLVPGVYQLVPQTPKGQMLPYGKPETATVMEGQYMDVTVSYDSGIR